ncbi:putative amino acid permease YhdG [compost metagenome]
MSNVATTKKSGRHTGQASADVIPEDLSLHFEPDQGEGRKELHRRLHVGHVVGLAMADVSPAMSVLLLSAGVFATGGTFALGACAGLAVVVVLIAVCLGELASTYPNAGGMYSLVRSVLPAPFSWVTMLNCLIQGVVIPASISLGIAIFLEDLWPGIGVSNVIIALISLALAAGIAMLTVEFGTLVTLPMVGIEILVLGIVTVAALTSPHQELTTVLFDPVMLDSAGTLIPVSIAVMFATMAPAFNVINGYDASLGFVEELKGGEKKIAKAVVWSAVLASLLIFIPLVAAVVAAPNIKDFLSAEAPIIYVVEQALGPYARYVVDVGVICALFNAMISLFMYFGRGVYATGRDNIWPAKISRALGALNRFGAPGWGVICLFVPACVLIFFNALDWLIIFAGTLIASVYFCIGLAAIWSRIKHKEIERPSRMFLWPLPPIVVTLFTGMALMQQETEFLLGEVVLIAVALALWAISGTWRNKSA